ncbi:hypothetical protein [Streptomyces longwoodensis]|uniref:hypothetical protein n=1 Tax=Streptomyces longwoodensis TaxID=68231 RepID=UPI00224DCD5F|nr:hypothetical protein [Streptomyces longwoodensis]MCX5000960.1 hypothetical protein [Streptomyces longwoodensis]
MTCEDTMGTPARLTWEIQLYEPHSRVWICKGYGRATTTAEPADIARAVLAGHLAVHQARHGETFRALARIDDGPAVTVTADQLPDDGWTIGPDTHRALPVYLRQALEDRLPVT